MNHPGKSTRTAKPWRHVLFFLTIAVLIGFGHYRQRQHRISSQRAEARHYVESFTTMGTVAQIQFWEEDPAASRAAATKVREIFEAVDARFSAYKPESELSRLNASAFQEAFPCSPEMWELLLEARDAWQYTQGAFDISAGPLLRLWGMYRRERQSLPSDEELVATRAAVGLDKVIFDEENKTVRFSVDGMYLDPGGIAKGYAVEKAAEALSKQGIRVGIIDLGGNLYCFPDPPPNRNAYHIQVRHPRSALPKVRSIGHVVLRDQAIATSGDYERFVEIEGKRYGHIIDPRTGYPARGPISVTVLVGRATISDTLSTGIYVNGKDGLDILRQRFPELQVLILEEDEHGTLFMTRYPSEDKAWSAIRPLDQWDP